MATWKRFVLGVFVFAWLNVAAQPCVMALDLSHAKEITADAPESEDNNQHAGHHDESATEPECGHCPPSGEHSSHCSTSTAISCADVPFLNAESRQTKLKLNELSYYSAPPAMPAEQALFPEVTPEQFLPVARLKHESEPTRTIRYCVFLI